MIPFKTKSLRSYQPTHAKQPSGMSPKFLENILKKEYGKRSATPYKVMNKMGAMKGNKETAKGRAMTKKHLKDTVSKTYKRFTRT